MEHILAKIKTHAWALFQLRDCGIEIRYTGKLLTAWVRQPVSFDARWLLDTLPEGKTVMLKLWDPESKNIWSGSDASCVDIKAGTVGDIKIPTGSELSVRYTTNWSKQFIIAWTPSGVTVEFACRKTIVCNASATRCRWLICQTANMVTATIAKTSTGSDGDRARAMLRY